MNKTIFNEEYQMKTIKKFIMIFLTVNYRKVSLSIDYFNKNEINECMELIIS